MKKERKILGTTAKAPFTIVSCETENGKEYFIACGRMRDERMFNSFEDAEEAIERKDWELITLLTERVVTWLMDPQNK